MIKISQRLSHLADMVTKDMILADVGTDHGYIPIYLMQIGKIQRAFAMDIGKGPLLRAKEHIETCGLGEYITLRLSDGVNALKPREAESILIAGMGGGVMLHILEQGKDVVLTAKELILQPQSEIVKVREYLYENGYVVDREDMVFEDGKYYPMMHVIPCRNKEEEDHYSREEWQMFYRYGKVLLESRNEVLQRYLLHTINLYETILNSLWNQQQTEAIQKRREQVEEELGYARQALQFAEYPEG